MTVWDGTEDCAERICKDYDIEYYMLKPGGNPKLKLATKHGFITVHTLEAVSRNERGEIVVHDGKVG